MEHTHFMLLFEDALQTLQQTFQLDEHFMQNKHTSL